MSEVEIKKVSVVGLGYIGLPTAAMFASKGVEVLGVDVNQSAIDTINQGKVHIVEPDLDMAVKTAVEQGKLRASLTPEAAQAFLIAVPTPFKGSNHEPDLSYIEDACRAIAPVLESGNIVILESTSPVGTTEQMALWLASARPDLTFPHSDGKHSDIRIAYCPERVLPGKVMGELISNDRVIGGMTKKCSSVAAQVYKTFVKGECIFASSPRVAEMAKLTENSFRDVNIAFANELSLICEDVDVNVWELISMANRHPRVNILQPGPGVGGHCIAVDPWFIVSKSPDLAHLIKTAREVNNSKPDWVVKKVKRALEKMLSDDSTLKEDDVVVACYGIAFKPDIDDLRESPSLEIAKTLSRELNCAVQVVEPNIKAIDNISEELTLVEFGDALQQADIHVMLVDHQEFLKAPAPEGVIVDVRGVWS